jgi:hypothetical protein
VAVRGFEEYRPVLEETFRHYGVPLYASTRTDVQTHPLPALMGSVFDLFGDGWSYESMFTYLKTGLAPISRADCDILENYVLTWSLRGTAWTREQPWRQHPDGFGGKFEGDVPARLAHIDALRRQVAARWSISGWRARKPPMPWASAGPWPPSGMRSACPSGWSAARRSWRSWARPAPPRNTGSSGS